MLYDSIKKLLIKENQTDEVKVMYLYRYLSWLLTSTFYIIGQPYSQTIFKLGVVFSLFLLSKFATDLYVNNMKNSKTIKTLLMIETIGIALLLIPTGGLHSPFLWYATNPVLIAIWFLGNCFSWLYLTFYLLFSTIISYVFFNITKENPILILINNMEYILVFLLITVGMELLTIQTKRLKAESIRLEKVNKELTNANIKINESMEYIMSLYQVVETFTTYNDKENIIKVFVEYTKNLTKTSVCFFWSSPDKRNGKSKIEISSEGKNIQFNDDTQLKKIWTEKYNKSHHIIYIDYRKFLIIPVKSTTTSHGLIGISIDKEKDELKNYRVQLNFLCELISIIIERIKLEEINDKLIVSQEQNRIANEIHDNVSQRLFGISCAVHTLMKNWDNITQIELKNRLTLIQNSSNTAMKELRSTIYRLSSTKKGNKVFESDIKILTENISKLNNITINVDIKGNENSLSVSLKKALYRIISEASGNSIKHGKCTNINIKIHIEKNNTLLQIEDNGKGFILKKLNNKKNVGLGINNIKILVENFSGNFKIDSIPGKGTKIKIIVENNNSKMFQEGGFAI